MKLPEILASYRFRLSLMFLVLTISVSSLGIFLTYKIGMHTQTEGLRRGLTAIAATGALLIDAQELQKIDPWEKIPSPLRKKIARVLVAIKESNPDIRYVYTMIKSEKPNIWLFVVNDDDLYKEEFTEKDLADVEYDISRFPQMPRAFEGPTADKKLTVDKWGTWFSGYAPIRDKDGKAAAILGVDMAAKTVAMFRDGMRIQTMRVLGSGIALAVILSAILANNISRPIRMMVKQTERIANGDFDARIGQPSINEMNRLAASFNHMSKKLQEAFKGLESAHRETKHAYIDTIYRLAMAVEYRDKATRDHLVRVSDYSAVIAEKIGFPPEEVEIVRYGSIMHDVGKVGISDVLLSKGGPLSDREFEVMKNHALIGSKLFENSDFSYLKAAGIISLSHHERYDGTGYPGRLKGEGIPLYGRIAALADAFDALSSTRSYRQALPFEEVVRMIKEESGKQFDPKIVDAFLASLDKFKKIRESPVSHLLPIEEKQA